MPDGREPATIRVVPRIADVPAEAWDRLTDGRDPFVSHAFLSALEDSGSAVAETGWLPQHLVVDDGAGGIAAAAPLYLKNHSYGEYVFDWGWADAYHRAGGRYYPKLQCSVPFTPVTGRRFLTPPDAPPETRGRLIDTLVAGMLRLADRDGASSVHVAFPVEDEWTRMGAAGLMQRIGCQYHWQNKGYATFDDFLGELSSRKRKSIRKERAKVAEQGVALKTLSGSDLTEAHWDAFYRFYCDTTGRKWGGNYLTREFFSLLGARMADRVVLVLAEHGGRPVAGALNLKGDDALYGRHWGCDAEFRFLHFEACYYRAIDYAIAHGLKRVEAGAQGEHKIQRGYLPTRTLSAHWIRDPGLGDAVASFLARERVMMEREIEGLGTLSPFRRSNDQGGDDGSDGKDDD